VARANKLPWPTGGVFSCKSRTAGGGARWHRSMAGLPRSSTRPLSKPPRRCSTNSP